MKRCCPSLIHVSSFIDLKALGLSYIHAVPLWLFPGTEPGLELLMRRFERLVS